jgi:hypothetical protein
LIEAEQANAQPRLPSQKFPAGNDLFSVAVADLVTSLARASFVCRRLIKPPVELVR